MGPKRILVVGSLNIDLVTRVGRLPRAGETLSGSDLILIPGGKGANQACAVARLGRHVTMIGQVGDDPFGELLLTSLRDAGVDTRGVGTSAGATGAASISVLPSGENAIVISPAANARLTPELALARLDDLKAGDLVLLQLETPLATVRAVLDHAADRGAVAILDPAPARPLSNDLLRNVGYLTPNESEAALLLGGQKPSIGDVVDARQNATHLLELGAQAVILKLGPQGCFVAADGFRSSFQGFAVDAVDSTAAGDTFNGAFAVGLAEGMSIPEAARFANAAAALSVTRLGAQTSIPNREEVTAFLNRTGQPGQEMNQACT
jgi:ribokinase